MCPRERTDPEYDDGGGSADPRLGSSAGRTHIAHRTDWEDALDQTGQPTLRYVGATKGWYLAPRWSELEHFGSRREDSDGFDSVYLVHAPATGRVKIGRSTQVYKRFSALRAQSGADLELIAVLPEESELNLHRRFADRRLNGEWFDESVLEDLRADGTIE